MTIAPVVGRLGAKRMGEYDPKNEETAVYHALEIPGVEVEYDLSTITEGFTLDTLIEYLREFPADEKFSIGLCNAHSWRGIYAELAFEPCRNVTAGQMLILAESCLDREFQGYKGGWFTMSGYTDVHIDYIGRAYGSRLSRLMMEGMRTYGS